MALAIEYLLSGAVLLVPSETVCALVTLWSNQAGRQRIYDLKHRPEDKRLQMLAASLEQAAACGLQVSPRLQKLAEAFWPGPLTLVCPADNGQSIGLRIPANDFLLDLLQGLGSPWRLPAPIAPAARRRPLCGRLWLSSMASRSWLSRIWRRARAGGCLPLCSRCWRRSRSSCVPGRSAKSRYATVCWGKDIKRLIFCVLRISCHFRQRDYIRKLHRFLCKAFALWRYLFGGHPQ